MEGRLDMHAIDIYGLSEVIGPGVGVECVDTKDGLHIWEDHFYPEIIDPITGEVLPDGSYGELVFTSLTKEAMPVVRYRTRDLGASRLLYVVGAPQRTHFAMVYAVAAAAGWLPEGVRAQHVGFGSILGADGRMFRTRSGESVPLAAVLDEAVARAGTLTPSPTVARAVGIGAMKYADLSGDRMSDYVFDWDRMLALTGNTGPYLQYAYARTQSIVRRAGSAPGPIRITTPVERALALELLGFAQVVTELEETLQPHRLAGLGARGPRSVQGGSLVSGPRASQTR